MLYFQPFIKIALIFFLRSRSKIMKAPIALIIPGAKIFVYLLKCYGIGLALVDCC